MNTVPITPLNFITTIAIAITIMIMIMAMVMVINSTTGNVTTGTRHNNRIGALISLVICINSIAVQNAVKC